ncbi:MAG: hypothetical protein IT196_22585 [Acidimicrobiales bacterium]|nr:hypothetical protein [Acidimicrobiales bacterium]
MPTAAEATALSSTWICPGVPAPANGTATGKFSILNPTSVELTAVVTLYPSEGNSTTETLQLKPGIKEIGFASSALRARYIGAVIEVQAGSVAVEQTVVTPAGQSISPCASGVSGTWYLGEGATVVDACETLVAFNPFPDDAIVDIRLVTDTEQRTLSGTVLKPRSVQTIALQDIVRRNTQVSVAAEARSGAFVLGRVQERGGCGQPTGTMSAGLASPSAGSDFWFARVDKKDNWSERIVVFNPSADEAEIDIELRPFEPAADVAQPVQRTLAGRSTFVLDVAKDDTIPTGSYSVHVQSVNGVGVVAELATERAAAAPQQLGASIMVGARRTADRWLVPVGSTVAPAVEELAIHNPSGEAVTAKLKLVGPGGTVDVPGSQTITVPGGASVMVPVQTVVQLDPLSLEVEATGDVVVERLFTTDKAGLTRTAAIPVRS